MGCPACLITASPEFEDTEQTRPILLPETAAPDLRSVVDLARDEVMSFEAQLAPSEDKGEPVEVRLYVDYGKNLTGNSIAFDVVFGADVPPFDSSQPARIAQADINAIRYSPGCHTATLIVSHEFDNPSQCPKRLDDSTQLAWQFAIRNDAGDCPDPEDDPCACPALTAGELEALVSCPDIAENFVPSDLPGGSP